MNVHSAIEVEHIVSGKKWEIGKPGTNNTITANRMPLNRATTRDVQYLCE